MSIRLVAGLGNDEKKYDLTPHNIGFQALDVLVRRLKLSWEEQKGRVVAAHKGEVRLVKAHSLMNVSGEPLQWASHWWHIPAAETLIVCDDFALPWGRLRLRKKGSAGGHNGLDSVIRSFGTEDIPRLRVGVGPVPPGMDPKDYVLKKMDKDTVMELAEQTADAVASVLSEGFDAAMNHVNAAPAL